MYIFSHSGTLFPFIGENKIGLSMASTQFSGLEIFQDKGKIMTASVNHDPAPYFYDYQNVAALVRRETTFLQNANNNICSKIICIYNLST
ncbi:hypothetical protein BT93_I1658 [Corymbia citriodora subsp. variegata]|nr:hypothetical protein BT93_I1658 [Corymbia citriodora subsp. variegata]